MKTDIMALIVFFMMGFNLCIPVIQKQFTDDMSMATESLDPLGDEPVDPPAYDYWYAPSSSFGIRERKTINRTTFQSLFDDHFYKNARYKRYSYSDWTDGTEYLSLNKTWNSSSFWKVDIILDIPVDLYSVNISFGCDLPVLQYVEREGYKIWLNYSANETETETYQIVFNWSDIANIPNLEISKHRMDGKFWISFKRDNVPAGYYIFDPTFGYTTTDRDFEYPIADKLVCGKGKPALSGTVDSLTIYMYDWDNGQTVKGLLYDSGLNLIGTTDVSTTGEADDWFTFTFSAPKPSVTADNIYYVGAIADIGVSVDLGYSYDDEADDQGGLYVETMDYDNPENPIGSWDTANSGYSVMAYGTYTEGVPWSNVCPVASGEQPSNGSTGEGLQRAVGCTITDSNSNHTMNVTFATNVSGGWINYQTNSSVANNSAVNWTYSQANVESTKYYWRVYVHDGICNQSFTFYYTTSANETPWSNIDPVISGEQPSNQSTDQELSPACGVTLTDSNSNHTFNVTYASNYSDGSTWVNYQTNSSVANDSATNWTFTGASSYSTRYWWKVFCHDGFSNVSECYHFTTKKHWVILDTWNVTLSNTPQPYILDTWNLTLSNTPISYILDTWNITLSNLTISSYILDTWNLTLSNLTISAFIIDTWNITLSNTPQPYILDTWNLTLSNTPEPYILDTWNITLSNLSITSFTLDTWNITLSNTSQPYILDTWNLTLSNTPEAIILDTWNITLSNLTISAFTIDTWNITLSNTPQPYILDTWNITLSNLTISPYVLDTWNLTLSNTAEGNILDKWNLTLSNLTISAFIIDTWNLTLSNTPQPYILDTWNLTLSNLTISSYILDTWNLTLSNTPEAIILDTWNLTIGNLTITPYILDTWNLTLSNTTEEEIILDTWNLTLSNLTISSYTLDTWNITLSNVPQSYVLDTWNITLGNLIENVTLDLWNMTLSNTSLSIIDVEAIPTEGIVSVTSVNITCTVTSPHTIINVTVNMTGTSYNMTNIGDIYYYSAVYNTVGTHYYHIYANDTSGDQNESDTYSFRIFARSISCSFTYTVKGGLMTLTPTIAGATHYRWIFTNETGVVGQTQWIPIADINSYIQGYTYRTTINALLSARNINFNRYANYSDKIKITRSSIVEPEPPEIIPVVEPTNIFKDIADTVGKWTGERNTGEILFMIVIAVLISLFVIRKKYPPKKFIYPVLKKRKKKKE